MVAGEPRQQTLDARLASLRARLGALDLDAYAATARPARAYLTGYGAEGYERLIAAVVGREAVVLVVPSLEEAAAAEQAPGVARRVWADGDDPVGLVARVLDEEGAGAGRIAVEEDDLTLGRAERLRAALPSATLVPGGALVAELRLRKDSGEIDAMRRAAGLLDSGLELAFASARVGTTELALQALLEQALKAAGAERVISLVQFGERAALPHGSSGSRTLRNGDVVLIDAALPVDGYWADITRCATVGRPAPDVVELWRIVTEAHDAGVAAVAPGARAADVDLSARAVIEAAGHGPQFVHRTGHGLGLEVHEPPYLNGTSEAVLDAGMAVSVEPGIYLPGRLGLRLEDQVIVTAVGREVITGYSRALAVL